MNVKNDYILGTEAEELQRLEFQHRVWSKNAFALWEHADLGQGQRILDLGCGPGCATFDLATIVGPQGEVIGLDLSPRYIAHARSRAEAMNLANIKFTQCSFEDMRFERGSFDAIYARWVFAWINNVEEVVQRACALLKPGGRFLCHEYLKWGTFRLIPEARDVSKVIEASLESWRKMDSEIDIAAALPRLFERNGLGVSRTMQIAKVAKPRQMVWQWLATFLQIYSLKLIDMGLLTTAERDAFLKTWSHVEKNPDSMLIAPLVMEIIGTKT